MTCPYLEYRRSDGDGQEFDHERPYCPLMEEFVSPMKADICNDRDRFDHTTYCEVYRAHQVDAEATAEGSITDGGTSESR